MKQFGQRVNLVRMIDDFISGSEGCRRGSESDLGVRPLDHPGASPVAITTCPATKEHIEWIAEGGVQENDGLNQTEGDVRDEHDVDQLEQICTYAHEYTLLWHDLRISSNMVLRVNWLCLLFLKIK